MALLCIGKVIDRFKQATVRMSAMNDHESAMDALKAAEARIAQLELAAKMTECLVNAGSFQMDWDTMRVIWSANTLRLFGLTEDEFDKTYTSIAEFIHPDDRASFDRTMAHVIATREPYSHRHRIIRRDGEIRHVRELGATAGGPTGNLFFGVTQDITELVQAQAAEAELQSMVQLAGEVARLGSWALDIQTGLVEISPVTAELHDMPDVRQKPMAQAFNFFTAESRARIEAAVARSIEDKAGFDESLTMVSATGVFRQVRVVVKPVLSDDGKRLIRLTGAMQDVTEFTKAQDEAQRADDFSRMAGRVAQLGGWRIDAATRIVRITPVTAALHDLPSDVFLTLDHASEFYAPPERMRLEAALQNTFENGQDFDANFEITTAKGRNVTLRITGQAMRSDDGTCIIGAQGGVQDVTSLLTMRQRAETSERLLEIAGTSAHFGAWRYDALTEVLEWSRQISRVHGEPDGYSPSLAAAFDYFVPEYRNRIKALFQSCLDHGEPYDNTLEIISAKGRRLWIRVTGEAERDETGRIVALQGSLQDVNELMTVRQRADESDRLLEIAGRACRLGGWTVSLVDQKVFWSDGVALIHEVPIGATPTFQGGIDYFAPHEQDAARRVFDACVKDGIPFDNVRDLITAKGHLIKVRSIGEPVRDSAGRIIAVQGAMQDITELMETRAENERLATKIQETIDGLPDPFLFLDKDLRMTYLNRRAEAVLDYTAVNMVGHELLASLPALADTRLAAVAREAMVSRKTLQVTERIKSLGKTFAISAYPVAESVAIFLRDVSEDVARAEQLDLLEKAVSRSNDIILITKAEPLDGPDNPTIVYVNDAFTRLTGFSREEVIGKSPRILQGPKTQRPILDKIRNALTGWQPVRAELINYTKAGQEFWLELDIVPITNEKGWHTHWVSVERDITDRKIVDAQIRLSEERFRLIAQVTGNAVWEWDLAGGQKWWSDGRSEIFGMQPDVWHSNIYPNDMRRIHEAWDRLVSGQVSSMHEFYKLRRADGTWATVEDRAFSILDDKGQTVRVLGSMTDISERLNLEEQVRLNDERFRLVSAATSDVIWDSDIETQDIWWNENIERSFGYKFANEKTTSDWWLEKVHPEDRTAVWESLRAAIEGSSVTWQAQYRFYRADGSIATVVDKGYIIRDVHGKPVRILGSLTDITDRLEIDALLRQAQKLEAVGQLTGGVAHDFNNLLLVILGNAEDLGDLLSDQPQLQKMAKMTMIAAQRGAELTSRLLAFSRKQALSPKAVDVNQLVQGIEGMLRRTLPESVDIELIKGADVWTAFIDEGQMETALLNLAINARDAMGGNGHLTIETSNSFIDEGYASQHQEVKSDEYVLISVSDTGCGMNRETLVRVFEPFFTTKDVGQGSGLGLSMVYGYIKQSGGHIKIYSEVGVGTTIKLYVPRAAVSKLVGSTPMRPTMTLGNGEHILVVEDDELVREHLSSQLRTLNYRVTTVENGHAALALIRATDDLDLLFTDVVMPGGMNGRQLVDAAHLIRPELRVLYTSGYTENSIVHQGRLDVGIELLSKPYRREELASKLRKIFGGRTI